MNTYIVTIKLPKNPEHNPRAKVTGDCPIGNNYAQCTDVTGEHHSFLMTGSSIEEVRERAIYKFKHVTRVEEIK